MKQVNYLGEDNMTDSGNSRDGDSAAPDIRIVIDQASSFPPIRRIAATHVFT
jgi:hypothetical protein